LHQLYPLGKLIFKRAENKIIGGSEQMSDNQGNTQQLTPQAQLKDIEAIRDLFARAHDFIAQANHPGHLGNKVAEVLNFLAFQFNDFKQRGEALAKRIEAEAKAELSKVDVVAAQSATAAVLDQAKVVEAQIVQEPPKA
jgi:hypothetical protein